jgi:tetratricopeptide (TPR) repeat protein
MPFRVIGDQSALGYVADGLRESVSTKLFGLKDVRLTSAAEADKIDPKMPVNQIAKNLGVNLVVQGTVQGTLDQLRITVRLENASENKTVWNEDFSGMSGDLLSLQDKIYGKLATALGANTSDSELAGAAAHPTENVDAYDLYLRGKNAMRGQFDPKSFQTAIDYFNQSMKKDPNFALAYTGLANASLRMYAVKKEPVWSERALTAARRAAELNDKLPEVHMTLGTVYSATGQNSQAIAELKRGQELAPNSDEAYQRLGNAYAGVGQKDLAIEALAKAVEINPYYWMNTNSLGQAYYSFWDYERALKAFQQVVQLEPENSAGYNNIGSVYIRLGRYEDSIGVFKKSLELQPDPLTYSSLATSLFYLKRYSEAVPMFEKAVEMSPSDQTMMGNLGDGYRWAGQQEKANLTYKKAIALCSRDLQVDPRSSSILGQMALYYAKSGDLPKARELLQRAKGISPGQFDLYYAGATLEAIANRPAEAIAELTKAMQKGQPAADAEADPELALLRTRPDYQALIKEYSRKK